MSNLGYNQNLFILPFDHRGTFREANFKDISEVKQIIYEAFKKSSDIVKNGAILIDEEYGDVIIKDAKSKGFTVLLTTEKSGEEDFVFEYEDYQSHIEKYKPTFVKALIRVKNGVGEVSKINLKKLSDYCHANGFKLLLEVLAEGQLELILNAVSDLQNYGIEVDVWKIEGMQNELSYEKIVNVARVGGRDNVSIVILGRGENRSLVEKWIKTGSKVAGVIGFAIGRTIFWDPITQFTGGKITREQAVGEISENYKYFYNLFLDKK